MIKRGTFFDNLFTLYIEACEGNRWEERVIIIDGIDDQTWGKKRQLKKSFMRGACMQKMNEYI